MGEESITPSQVTTSIQKKKKSLFKSIKGSLKRKKKKSHPDDDSVGVSVASNSVAAPSNTPAPSAINGAPPLNVISEAPIQIILLLMDPQSRRFELLQLEFSADKALVSDILVQISQSATEKTLREMEYGGVCDRSGMELIRSMKLSSVVKGKIEVVLAMPKGMGGKEVGEMARPILEDAKVVEMLRPCGVELPKKRSRGASGSNSLGKIDEEKTTESKINGPSDAAKTKTEKKSIIPTAALGIVMAALFFFAIQRHFQLVGPIQSGHCLKNGKYKNSCGIWELLGNRLCDSLSMGKDGKLRYYSKSSDKLEEVWSTGAAECAAGEQCVQNADCNGAIFTREGEKWFVDVNGVRTLLSNDVVQKFT